MEFKCACASEGARKAVAIRSRSQATEKNMKGNVEEWTDRLLG